MLSEESKCLETHVSIQLGEIIHGTTSKYNINIVLNTVVILTIFIKALEIKIVFQKEVAK